MMVARMNKIVRNINITLSHGMENAEVCMDALQGAADIICHSSNIVIVKSYPVLLLQAFRTIKPTITGLYNLTERGKLPTIENLQKPSFMGWNYRRITSC
jgi:hypothetical protein